jgi:hypothetical protein
VVLKILAYSREVDEWLDSSSRKNGLVPEAGYLKEGRSSDRYAAWQLSISGSMMLFLGRPTR